MITWQACIKVSQAIPAAVRLQSLGCEEVTRLGGSFFHYPTARSKLRGECSCVWLDPIVPKVHIPVTGVSFSWVV